jgi:hypothetical protein
MPTTHRKDRRASERVTVRSPLVLSAEEGAEPARLRNLSVAGIACTTARRYAEMTKLKISLELAPADPEGGGRVCLEVTGAVVRCRALRHGTGNRRYELAVYFTDLSEPARLQLAEIVRSRQVAPAT